MRTGQGKGSEQRHLRHLAAEFDGADGAQTSFARPNPFAVVIVAPVHGLGRLRDVAELLLGQEQTAFDAAFATEGIATNDRDPAETVQPFWDGRLAPFQRVSPD